MILFSAQRPLFISCVRKILPYILHFCSWILEQSYIFLILIASPISEIPTINLRRYIWRIKSAGFGFFFIFELQLLKFWIIKFPYIERRPSSVIILFDYRKANNSMYDGAFSSFYLLFLFFLLYFSSFYSVHC